MDTVATLTRLGGVASRAQLESTGLPGAAIDRSVGRGVRRVRRGWYATDSAHPDVVRAVEVGGALSCVSALAALGVWTLPHHELHVRVARGVRLGPTRGVRVHWSAATDRLDFPLDSPVRAFELMLRCADLTASIVAADSALNRRLIASDELAMMCAATPRGRLVLGRLDGASESGLETVARIRLRRLGVGVQAQVTIASVGRVDLLIGDRLVLELDGARWHGDFESDRRRDRALVAAGYIVVRASYAQVLHEWSEVETQILTLVRRREHLWRASHRALGHQPRSYRG